VTRHLLEKFERTNRCRQLIQKNDAIVVGVSGGPDSMALLELLCKVQRKYSLRLIVAHLDHGLQKSSQKVRAFVQKAAERNALPCYTERVNVRTWALKNKLSLEDAGREQRYRFFEALAKKTRSNKIATAHTLDDQAETFLMRLVRGSGLRGLSGIPYKRKLGTAELVRPLLDCSKKNLLLFLKKNNISFIQDKMNRNPVFLRNRIRHELLPLLRSDFNPQIEQVLASLQVICADAQDYLGREGEKAFRRCCVKKDRKKMTFNLSCLKKLHPALRYEVLAASVEKLRGKLSGFGYAHWTALDLILDSSKKEGQVHWPHRVRAEKIADTVIISISKKDAFIDSHFK